MFIFKSFGETNVCEIVCVRATTERRIQGQSANCAATTAVNLTPQSNVATGKTSLESPFTAASFVRQRGQGRSIPTGHSVDGEQKNKKTRLRK